MLATNWLQPISHLQLLHIFGFRYQNGIGELFEARQAALLCGIFECGDYSHSIVAGGLLVISYTILLIFFTSFTILTLAFSRTSYGILAKSAVMKSVVVTPRSASV